ncbi:histidine phosphatase family protein [Fundidesulfovibrio butyratiphilus]
MTRLALIRHGQTEWNVIRRIQGQHDSPLTAEGRAKLTRWAKNLSSHAFEAVYSSPLGRARDTAASLAMLLGLPPVRTDDRLSEQAFGTWTGRLVSELDAEGVMAEQTALGWAFCPPEGESRQEVFQRAFPALLDIAAAHKGGQVLVVTHQVVLRSVLYALQGRDFLPRESDQLRPRALHWLEAEGGCLRVAAINQTL